MYWSMRKCSVEASVWRYDLPPKASMPPMSSRSGSRPKCAVRRTRHTSQSVTPAMIAVWVGAAPQPAAGRQPPAEPGREPEGVGRDPPRGRPPPSHVVDVRLWDAEFDE